MKSGEKNLREICGWGDEGGEPGLMLTVMQRGARIRTTKLFGGEPPDASPIAIRK
jgi:hypothetical protein